ncbi:N-acetylmuramic acid 6-phosphate etherase [Salinarimonas soli]|uniref:N-acetylmuramic acid 6-phosphate etherase n=1 Tax=Salinarimonas soli TaxID=1638099 RepID=A0A5B2W1C3_9HYPH|nr:N-acetylmuramic acid 6-phosphate etherase [Salinarimonas soli]KAA2244257.1 N-acetylmuramic acid 6-phosphate etherase [Salinarimonas soli]
MPTEDVSPRHVHLDEWPILDAVESMWEGQMSAVAAVRPALPAVAGAVAAAAAVLGDTGRLVYAGAGTSGRVAVQDGAELPPTFGWPLERLVFAMAGGMDALVASAEGAEDDEDDAARQIEAAALGPADVLIAIAASGTTPFTVAAARAASARGAVTIGIANNAGAPLLASCRHPILIETGSEVIAGSTRMKAGTAQKVVLNLISTGIMTALGRIHAGLMVNMHLANAKLRLRAERMVAHIAGCDAEQAAAALARAGGDIKRAVLIALGADEPTARAALDRSRGNLRRALVEVPGSARS